MSLVLAYLVADDVSGPSAGEAPRAKAEAA
jgi:hypothetical protein